MPATTRKKSESRIKNEITPELIENIAASIRNGVPLKYAALNAGVSDHSAHRWMREHDSGTDLKGKPISAHRAALVAQFCSSIQQAKGEFVANNAAAIQRHKDNDWRAASWMLSHSPDTKEEWSDAGRVRIEVERHLTVMTTVLQRELAPADYERVLFALAEAQSFQEVA